MRKRRITVGLALSALTVASTAFIASPAQAACTLTMGTTYKSGNYIYGSGGRTSDCGSGTSTLSIQRSRWYGWEFLVSKDITGSGSISYNCAGTGTHTYRTIQQARTVGGSPRVVTSNETRHSC